MQSTASFAVLGYMCFSSVLLLLNKFAIHHTNAPCTVLALQLACSAGAVRLAAAVGHVDVDALVWSKAKAFLPVSMTFLVLIFTNLKTLQFSNVETFIVFRTTTPVLISVLDFVYLGHELPSARSWGCLAVLVAGAALYVKTDAAFNLSGYGWLAVWYGIFVFDQVYVKHVIQSVPMRSTWGRVYYTNLLAVPPLLYWCPAELSGMWATASVPGIAALALSCAAGVGMSYFSFAARKTLSAVRFHTITTLRVYKERVKRR